jgi:hypothetical protein
MIRTYCNVAAISNWLVTVVSPYRYRTQYNLIHYIYGSKKNLTKSG